MSNPFKGFAAAGGSLVAASALMLVGTTSDDYQAQVDQLYGNYGDQWESHPSRLSTTRSFPTTQARVLPVEDIQLHQGVMDGLERLGEEFAMPHLIQPDGEDISRAASAGIPAELGEALNIAGQLAALAQFKCSLGGETAFFIETEVMLEPLAAVFASHEDATSSSLSTTLQRGGDAETRVCRFGKAAMARLER